MRVILIRHAQSENNIKKSENEKTYNDVKLNEPSISEKGAIQAEELSLFLKENNTRLDKSINIYH
jgi:broad specificity phosphatase PhoE